MNLMQIAQLVRSGQNPQQIIMNLLSNNASSSPLGQNIMQLAQQGNVSQLEQIARNLCTNQGKNFDAEFSAFKHQLGLE